MGLLDKLAERQLRDCEEKEECERQTTDETLFSFDPATKECCGVAVKTIFNRLWHRFNCDATTEEEAECYERTDRKTQIRHLTHNGTCIFFDLGRLMETDASGKWIFNLDIEDLMPAGECDDSDE